MDELRGPNIQIVLHIKEGLGFGFLKNPFLVSGSLNGFLLETDPVVPCHAPIFDSELVWEADKRRFRNLRVQNVPIKIEVHSTSTQGRKDKIGYMLLSLLGAQPCPANKSVNINHSWHKLLGVRSEGKCCHSQLLMSLSVEDRTSTHTPRNELNMFHSNEVAYLSNLPAINAPNSSSRLHSFTYEDYLAESKKTVSSHELQPRLICEEGLIQIGLDSKAQHMFVLSFVIGAAENVDMLLSEEETQEKNSTDCFVTYSVFTHTIKTDRVPASVDGVQQCTAQFNQKTSLRVCTDLDSLSRYFTECPQVVTRLCSGEKDIGICSMDLRKLVPTNDVRTFVDTFCNNEKAITINERCFVLSCRDQHRDHSRKPFIDVEMSLKYIGTRQQNPPVKSGPLTARSASQLPSDRGCADKAAEMAQDVYRSTSCTQLDHDAASVTYTNITARNTSRYKNASGDAAIHSQNDIAELIKKMCDSFTTSQERLLASRLRPTTSDMQVQCEPVEKAVGDRAEAAVVVNERCDAANPEVYGPDLTVPVEKVSVKNLTAPMDRESAMKKIVEELEDWKEKQQQIFKYQLKQKEDYHLELLSQEWARRRLELECKLSKGIEQCRNLAADLSRATEDFRLRGFRNTEREKKLLEAKKALEQHYTSKYQELRDASQKMEDEMRHTCKLKDMRIEELETRVQQLEKQLDTSKNNLKNAEKDSENKYSGLTKDQTAGLIQELRCLEEKLDNATQSKSFFKEQWGRAVRELHFIKLQNRRQMLSSLQKERKQLGEMGLDELAEKEELLPNAAEPVNMKKLKDDFYVDLLASTPALADTRSLISTGSFVEGMDGFPRAKNMPQNPSNQRLNNLIEQRNNLIKADSPDEEVVKQLNHEIRNLLLNCGT